MKLNILACQLLPMLYSKTNRRTPSRKEEKQMLYGTFLFIALSLIVTLLIILGLMN